SERFNIDVVCSLKVRRVGNQPTVGGGSGLTSVGIGNGELLQSSRALRLSPTPPDERARQCHGREGERRANPKARRAGSARWLTRKCERHSRAAGERGHVPALG